MNVSKLLIIVGVVGLGLLLVVELLVRVLFPQPFDPGRRFILENDIPGVAAKVEFEIDPNQIRGFDSRQAKPAGALRVLCVGGASTSTMLQGEEETWWGQLGAGLEKSLGRKVQVGALVAPVSSRIIQGAQWVDHLLGEVEGVDLVIAMYGHGAVLNAGSRYSFNPEAIKQINFEKGGGGIGVSLAKVSHLVRVARNAHIKSKRNEQQRVFGVANYLRDRQAKAINYYRSLAGTTASPSRPSDPLAEYLYGLGIIYEATQRHGVKLVMVGEPTVFTPLMGADAAEILSTPVHVGPGDQEYARPLPEWVDAELARYYASAGAFCSESGVPFVNLQGRVLPTRANFFAESSLTDLGAGEAAKQLQPVVEKELK